jgi:putative ABC transport system permease protein
MRTLDLLRISLSALWQQKTRSALTTLGVMLGACMLTFSLSIGQGVQDTLNRQFRAHDDLRRIQVYGGRGGKDYDESGIPPEAIEVKGLMSEEKRQRIRKLLVQQWHEYNMRHAPVPLTQETMEKLRSLPHVESVNAGFYEQGRVALGDRSISAGIRPAPVTQRSIKQQLVAGAMPPSDTSRGVLVHEFLLYQLGVRDDADVERAIGKPLRLELYNHLRSPRILMALFDAQALTLTAEELRVLEKAIKQLPAAFEKMEMSPGEREILRQLLQRRDVTTKPPEKLVVTEEFLLAGVFRDLTPEEQKKVPFYEGFYRYGEVIVPQGAGVELAEKLPRRRIEGYNALTVIVDREENVRSVVDEVKGMGLEFYSAVDFVEHVLRDIRLVRFVTTFIAAVALLVSGLGITNTMVTSVLERTQEIGIMKAVGARGRDVQRIFLIEGSLLGLFGSGLGLLVAWLLSIPGDGYARKLMEQQTQNPIDEKLFVFAPWILISVVVFVMLITTLAALYPARRAARVDPIVALRHE